MHRSVLSRGLLHRSIRLSSTISPAQLGHEAAHVTDEANSVMSSATNGIPASEKVSATIKRQRFPPRTETFVGRAAEAWTSKIQSNVLLHGTRVKKSPFFESTLRYGCEGYTVYNKMLLPVKWTGQTAIQEYQNLCSNVNLYDCSVQRQVEICGPDAGRLAQYLCSRNLSNAKIGRCVYAICTDEEGTVINDPLILKLSEDRFWFSIADRDLVLWAKAHAYAQNLDVAVDEPDIPSIAIQGPKSLPLVMDLFGPQLEELKFFHFTTVEWHGIPAVVARSGWSPERGYEIYLDGPVSAQIADEMWQEVVDKGAPYQLMFGSPNQFRRLEGGMLSTCDYDNTNLDALEMNLPKKYVNVDMESDFVGKAALQKKKREGLSRKLMGIIFDTDAPMTAAATQLWTVQPENSTTDNPGYVTSSAFSPRLGTFLGIATLPIELADEGTRLIVNTPQGDHPATVSSMPFPDTIEHAHKN